jgi:hypothetical protein
MPYLIIRETEVNGNRVTVAGLKGRRNCRTYSTIDSTIKPERICIYSLYCAAWWYKHVFDLIPAKELAELKNFSPTSSNTSNPKNPCIIFPQPPCVMLNALEVLGFKVLSSTTSDGVVVWTLWKEFDEGV